MPQQNRSSLPVVIVVAAVLSTSVMAARSLRAQVEPTDLPTYAADGSLICPKNFDAWVFVGSNLGLSYKPGVAAMTAREAARANTLRFHNVYISRPAYDYFLTNKIFPDKTILVMEVFEASENEPGHILASGTFDGPRAGLEVAVKNQSRPDGSKTPWAYYDFTDETDPSKLKGTAAAFPDSDCESCHRLHARVDNVWVQFYPRLRGDL